MKFLPAKYTIIAMAFIMSLLMSGVISLAFIVMSDGLHLSTLAHWPLSWLKGWIVALPVAVLIMPFVRKFVTSITVQQ